MFDQLYQTVLRLAPKSTYWSVRLTHDSQEYLSVRQDVVQPPSLSESVGLMVTVADQHGQGYCASHDLSPGGIREAFKTAQRWASACTGHHLIDSSALAGQPQTGEHHTRQQQPWESWTLADKLTWLQERNRQLNIDARIVDRMAMLIHRRSHSRFLDSNGSDIQQEITMIMPEVIAIANASGQTQKRSYGGHGYARQGGLEQLAQQGIADKTREIAEQAIALLEAPECPEGNKDLILMPSQMILQIHESIGHPLELDRILGDERNYAGTSFVTTDMFGSYRYGSDLLNVTFDPTVQGQLASYAFDDEGTPASKEYLIKQGILQRPLGGALSQARAGMAGTANARACHWNRPAIDRMANINLEPGKQSLQALIAQVEDGVLMDTNCSWSIDDSRNKFQFGCELGRVIKNGELGGIVRNPNYRGISATFWRNLAGVGDRASWEIMGTPNCGKGEPNQVIQVGHASPPCLFRDVEIFGGAQ